MPTWQQEMGWYCGTCEKLNRGRYKECQNCGKAKEGEPFVDLPGEGEGVEWAVKDPELVKQAKAGPDWECIYCQSHQRRDNGDCANCGAKQGYSKDHETSWDDGTTGPSGDGLNEREEVEAEIAKDKAETERMIAEAKEESEHIIAEGRAEMPRSAPPPNRPTRTPAPTTVDLDDEPPSFRPRVSDHQKRLGAIAIGAALLVTLCYFLFRTTIVDATVATVSWEHKVEVSRKQVVRGEGFDESQPADAFDVESLGRRHHHDEKLHDGYDEVPYEDRYQCGEDCKTTPRTCTKTPVRCTSNKNGFKDCSGGDEHCTGGDRVCTPKYCTRTKYKKVERFRYEPRYETYYQWKVWRWVPNRTLVERGTNNEPFWPTDEKVGLNRGCTGGEEERASRSSTYGVVFEGPDHDKYNYTPKGLDEFRILMPGTKRKLKTRILGQNELVP